MWTILLESKIRNKNTRCKLIFCQILVFILSIKSCKRYNTLKNSTLQSCWDRMIPATASCVCVCVCVCDVFSKPQCRRAGGRMKCSYQSSILASDGKTRIRIQQSQKQCGSGSKSVQLVQYQAGLTNVPVSQCTFRCTRSWTQFRGIIKSRRMAEITRVFKRTVGTMCSLNDII